MSSATDDVPVERRRSNGVDDASATPTSATEESTLTVLVAGAANLGIAVAKGIAGLLSGSSSMLAEAAHSAADTINQILLLTALRRSRRPADSVHPFGYGMERYVWSLLAAVGIFVLGAGFSIYQGVDAIIVNHAIADLPITYAVLAMSALFEGTSWLRAVAQLRKEARQQDVSLPRHVVQTTDPTAKAVVFEDSAALVGLALAAGGVTLHAVTGSALWDGVASILIGLLLVVVAYSLGRQNMDFLLGRSADAATVAHLASTIEGADGVDEVLEVLTMRLGPDEILLAARVDVADDQTGISIERLADEVERRVRSRHPDVRHVFVDPTPSHDRDISRP